MLSGTAYGVILNDRAQLDVLGEALLDAPYQALPVAPVLYIKPRGCVTTGGAPVRLPADLPKVEVAATIGLLFGRDTARVEAAEALGGIVGACLAIDVSEPHASFYRPAIRQRCRDGFLPLGAFAPFVPEMGGAEIVTLVDGSEVHRWSLSRLARDLARLVADVSGFMTLAAGDLLLVGLAGDAPRVGVGLRIEVRGGGLPPLTLTIEQEAGR